VLTAHPAFGRWLKRTGLCGIPEDFATPGEVNAVTGDDRQPRRVLMPRI
jgi:hypothetical protein